ncbi:hypothetical protein ACFLT1_06435 [Bacteroidota bacterium]
MKKLSIILLSVGLFCISADSAAAQRKLELTGIPVVHSTNVKGQSKVTSPENCVKPETNTVAKNFEESAEMNFSNKSSEKELVGSSDQLTKEKKNKDSGSPVGVAMYIIGLMVFVAVFLFNG